MWPSRWSHNLWVSGSGSCVMTKKNHVWDVSCQRSPSITVSFIDCKRTHYLWQSKQQFKSICRDLINTLSSPIDHSVSSLKKKKMSRISIQFSCRLELLDGMLLRTWDLVVGLIFDKLPNICTSDFSMRLQRDSQVEWSSEHYFLNCWVEDINLTSIADTRTSSTCTCNVLVSICSFLHTQLRPIQVILVICDIAAFSKICPEFLCNFRLVHLSSFDIVSMRCKSDNGRFVLQIFHVELREKITSQSRSSKSIMHQFVFDSADAFHPCDTSKFHKYDVQYLLSNKIDNKSIVIVHRFRIIGSIPRCPCRGSFSSIFAEWVVDNVLSQICLQFILVKMTFDPICQLTNAHVFSFFHRWM